MGHSTASGRTGGGATQDRTAANPLPRGVAPNSRLGRAWKDAQNGEASMVVRGYADAIRREEVRRNAARNRFVRQAAQQTIDALTEEKRRIERAFLD